MLREFFSHKFHKDPQGISYSRKFKYIGPKQFPLEMLLQQNTQFIILTHESIIFNDIY